MISTLDQLPVGRTGKIMSMIGEKTMKRRLLEMGFVNDLPIKCELVSPMGDPKAYRIKGTLISLRNQDAKNIMIEEVVV